MGISYGNFLRQFPMGISYGNFKSFLAGIPVLEISCNWENIISTGKSVLESQFFPGISLLEFPMGISYGNFLFLFPMSFLAGFSVREISWNWENIISYFLRQFPMGISYSYFLWVSLRGSPFGISIFSWNLTIWISYGNFLWEFPILISYEFPCGVLRSGNFLELGKYHF